ncbi:MAG TPA: hypothetical protein VFY82_12745 [Acidimicrobiales bacterium]|nr:hypothetical protein [Acidimicrobiales bacterium]
MRPRVILGGLLAWFVASIVTASLVMVIWPGSFKLFAPVLCPDDQPDAYVVSYSMQTSDGTSTNFTLFCMGDAGQFTEVGSWIPLCLLTAAIAAGWALLVLVFATLAHLSRHHRPPIDCGGGGGGDTAAGPQDAPVRPQDAPVGPVGPQDAPTGPQDAPSGVPQQRMAT